MSEAESRLHETFRRWEPFFVPGPGIPASAVQVYLEERRWRRSLYDGVLVLSKTDARGLPRVRVKAKGVPA